MGGVDIKGVKNRVFNQLNVVSTYMCKMDHSGHSDIF